MPSLFIVSSRCDSEACCQKVDSILFCDFFSDYYINKRDFTKTQPRAKVSY